MLSIAGKLIAGTKDNGTSARLQVQACRALWAAGACHEIERRVDATLRLDGVAPAVRAQLSAARALASTRTESAPSAGQAAEAALAWGRHLTDEASQRIALLALAEAARNEGSHQLVLDRFTELRSMSRSEYLADEIRALQHLDRYSEVDTLLAKIRDEAQDKGDNVLPSFLYAQIWQDHNLAASMRPRRAPGRCCAWHGRSATSAMRSTPGWCWPRWRLPRRPGRSAHDPAAGGGTRGVP